MSGTAHQGASRIDRHFQTAISHRGDLLRQPLRAGLETGQSPRPIGDHLELAHTLRDGRHWKCRCDNAGTSGTYQELPTIHRFPSTDRD